MNIWRLKLDVNMYGYRYLDIDEEYAKMIIRCNRIEEKKHLMYTLDFEWKGNNYADVLDLENCEYCFIMNKFVDYIYKFSFKPTVKEYSLFKCVANGFLSTSDLFIKELHNKGVDLNELSQFIADIIATAYNDVLYRISDSEGDDYDLPYGGMGLPDWTLKERDEDGEETGGVLPELHNLIEW